MTNDAWLAITVIVGSAIGFSVIAGAMFGWLRRPRCPACRGKLERDRTANAGGIELTTGGRMYRCTACNAEYRRHHDEGPFIPRAAWDAGAREELPKAHALPRKAS